MKREEDQIQRSMVEFLEQCVPPPPLGPFWTAVNASPVKLSVRQANKQKLMGQKAGVPDIIMCWQGRFIGIEVKPPRRYLSAVQRDAHDAITACDGVTVTVRSPDELQDFLETIGVPMRGRIAA